MTLEVLLEPGDESAHVLPIVNGIQPSVLILIVKSTTVLVTPGDKQPIQHSVCKRSALQWRLMGLKMHLDVCMRACVSLINLNLVN